MCSERNVKIVPLPLKHFYRINVMMIITIDYVQQKLYCYNFVINLLSVFCSFFFSSFFFFSLIAVFLHCSVPSLFILTCIGVQSSPL